jgi:hypothetical protein
VLLVDASLVSVSECAKSCHGDGRRGMSVGLVVGELQFEETTGTGIMYSGYSVCFGLWLLIDLLWFYSE